MEMHDATRHGRRFALAAALFFAGAVLVMWGWNTVAVDLFDQTPMRYRHAIALQAAVFALAAVAPLVRNLFAATPARRRT